MTRTVQKSIVMIFAFVAALALVACSSDDEPTISTVAVTAADFSFTLPATVEGGLTRIEMTNAGQDSHHMQILKLNDGVSQADFQTTIQGVIQSLPEQGEAALFQIFEVAALAGGPSGAAPGGQSTAIVDLKAGEYTLVCFIAGADGVPHVAKGMVQAVTVTAPTGDAPAAPESYASVDLIDYAFLGVPVSLPTGETTLKVTNKGQEPHEFTVLKLEGIAAEQALALFTAPPSDAAPAGPPPFSDAGGFQAILPGDSGYAVLNLEAGNYFTLCFVPSPVNEFALHMVLGMTSSFTVE
jgi:hypothetical protein